MERGNPKGLSISAEISNFFSDWCGGIEKKPESERARCKLHCTVDKNLHLKNDATPWKWKQQLLPHFHFGKVPLDLSYGLALNFGMGAGREYVD